MYFDACLCQYSYTTTRERLQEDACELAVYESRPVKHPLIDRVRECSTTPDAAADFFRLLFQFKPEKRLVHDAACHAYLRATFDRLKAASTMSPNSSLDMVEGEQPSLFMLFNTAIQRISCSLHASLSLWTSIQCLLAKKSSLQ